MAKEINSEDRKTFAGCLGSMFLLLHLVTVTPLFLYLAFRVLVMCEATQADWVCFWIYAPCVVVLAVVRSVVEFAVKSLT